MKFSVGTAGTAMLGLLGVDMNVCATAVGAVVAGKDVTSALKRQKK